MPGPLVTLRKARFGVYEVDFRAGELRKSGHKIRLQDQPLQVLAMLLEHPREVVTREELRQKLWPGDTFVDFDHGLNNAINRLREALNDSPDTPQFIETLPRRGYRFVAEVNVETATTHSAGMASEAPTRAGPSSPAPETIETSKTPSDQPSRRATGLWLVAAVAVSAALALAYLSYKHPFSSSAATPIHSIAVLPLENLSGDPSQDYFADGMTAALITDLAQIKALQVASRTSTRIYKGSKKPLPQIAHELNVDVVVAGTVVRSGEHVRIDAQLILGSTDRHLWANSYERDLGNVVALQGEVARTIADEIHAQITPEERTQLNAAPRVNSEAYLAYLKGRYLWNERTESAVTKGIELFQEAIAKDPNYALAYSGLADSYGLLGFYGAVPPKDAYSLAKADAIKALELDSSIAEAHVSLGDAKLYLDWDWSGGEAEFKRAIELNPKYDTAYRKYSNYLAGMSRTDESIATARKALELDPVSITLSTHLGWMLYLAHQNDLALQQYKKTLEMDPNYARGRRDFSLALVEKGNYEDAIREARRAIELSQASPLMLEALGYAYAKGGRKDEARKVLRELREMSKRRYVSPFDPAVIHAGLGDKDAAFFFLEKALREHAGQLLWLNVYPALDNLRSDRRFAQIASRVGLPNQGQ